MTVVFAGGELDAFTFSVTPFQSTATSNFDSNFARRALRPFATQQMEADFTTSLTEGWFHCKIYTKLLRSSLADQSFILLQDSGAGQTVLQLDGDNGIFNLEYWNGSGFTQLNPDLNITNNRVTTIDIQWRIADVAGIFAVYIDSRLISSFTGDTLNAGFTTIDHLFMRGPSSFFNDIHQAYYSEIFVADEATIGWHLKTVSPDGAGNSTTWTGAFGDVNTASLNDGTFVSSATAEEVEQFTMQNIGTEAIIMNFEGVDAATSGPGFNNIGKGNQPITIGGTAQIDTAQTPAGGGSTSSLLLDGNSDYVAWNDNVAFALGGNKVTISAWIRLNSTGVTHNIATQYDFNNQRGWRFDVSSSNTLGFHASNNGTTAANHVNFAGSTVLTAGVDHHVAAVRKANGDWVVFLDGNIEAGPVTPTGTPHNSTGQLRIGVTANNVNFFNGWIDSFELIIGTARWEAPFTPPTGNLGVTSIEVKAIVLQARSRNVAVGPQNLQIAIRTDGTDFFSSNVTISSSFASGDAVIHDVNPDTSLPWTAPEINALEIGLISKP